MLLVLADGYLERFAVWVYAVALAAMFGASALYHRFPWRSAAARLRARTARPRDDLRLHRRDVHAVRRSRVQRSAREIVVTRHRLDRSGARHASSSSYWIHAPRWLSAIAYLAVGWIGLIALPEFFPAFGVAVAVLVIVGSGLYSVGALPMRASWPNPFPQRVRLPRDLPPARDRSGRHPVRGALARRALSGRGTLGRMEPKTELTEAEWRERLTPEQYEILRNKGTERAFTGAYWDEHSPGVYRCAGCGAELFRSDTKFDSGTGWPSFFEPAALDSVVTETDTSYGMTRTEVNVRIVRRAPRPRVRGRAGADRASLLHQLLRARPRAHGLTDEARRRTLSRWTSSACSRSASCSCRPSSSRSTSSRIATRTSSRIASTPTASSVSCTPTTTGSGMSGTRARVVEVLTRFEDGRLNILIEGGDRFRLEELTRGRSFHTGQVAPVEDTDDPADSAAVDEALELFGTASRADRQRRGLCRRAQRRSSRSPWRRRSSSRPTRSSGCCARSRSDGGSSSCRTFSRPRCSPPSECARPPSAPRRTAASTSGELTGLGGTMASWP